MITQIDIFGKEISYEKLNEVSDQKKLKKIEYMHACYGVKKGARCEHCINFCIHQVRNDRRYFKCEIYGESSSEATDWRKKWEACGLFEYEGD